MIAPALVLAAGLVAATPAAPPAQPAPADDASLLELSERTEDGRFLPYPSSSVLDVDVNSSVVVRFSPSVLAALTHAPATPSSARAETTLHLAKLASVQEAVNAAARDFLEADRLREEATARHAALAGEDLQRYQSAYAALGKAYRRVQDYMGKEAFSAFVLRSQDVTAACAQLLAEEQKRLQDQVRQDLEKVPSRVLTVTALVGNPPRPVHVPGYDSLAAGTPTIVQKTRFRFDEEFDAEYAAAKTLASKASDWNAIRAAALDLVRERLADLAKQMEAVAAASGTPAIAAGKEASSSVKQAVAELRSAAQAVQKAIAAAMPALQAAIHPPDDADPAVLLRSAVGALQDVAASVRPAVQSLSGALARLRAAKQALAPELEKLAADVSQLELRLRVTDVAASPRGAPLAPQVATFEVKLDQVRGTEISLLGTQRADGDVLTVSARVFDDDGEETRAVAGGEHTSYFRVRSRGFVADTGAVVLFTRPIAHDPGVFVPGAGAYAVFRFKGWRSAGQANSSFWYYTAPGLGVSAIAIPRSSDGATQLAWMGTFHLFGDVLQVAAGATTDAKPVWGFGIGLHRIAGLGKYF